MSYQFPKELNVSKRDWNEGGKRNRTHRDQRCYSVKILELLPIDYKCGDIASVGAVVNPDGDAGSIVDNTEPAAVGILPVGSDFGKQGLGSNVVLVLVLRLGASVFPLGVSLSSLASLTASQSPMVTASLISVTARVRWQSQTRMC